MAGRNDPHQNACLRHCKTTQKDGEGRLVIAMKGRKHPPQKILKIFRWCVVHKVQNQCMLNLLDVRCKAYQLFFH